MFVIILEEKYCPYKTKCYFGFTCAGPNQGDDGRFSTNDPGATE